MKVTYYPGCSLEGTARDYAESILGICASLEIQLEEIPDWNCCGATAAHSLNCTHFDSTYSDIDDWLGFSLFIQQRWLELVLYFGQPGGWFQRLIMSDVFTIRSYVILVICLMFRGGHRVR